MRTAHGMMVQKARKEHQRTQEAPPFATTRVSAHQMHIKFCDRRVGPEQVESKGQAVPTAEPSKSSPMNQGVRARSMAGLLGAHSKVR